MSIKSLFDILKVVTTFGIVDNLFNVGFIRELFLFLPPCQFFIAISGSLWDKFFSSSPFDTFSLSFTLSPKLCRIITIIITSLHHCISSRSHHHSQNHSLSHSLTTAAQLSLWDSEATSAKLNISATFFLLCAPTSINTQTFLFIKKVLIKQGGQSKD